MKSSTDFHDVELMPTPPEELQEIENWGYRLWTPPRDLTVSEWADKYRYIPPEENPTEHGKWRTNRAEYQRGMMDAFNEPYTHTIVLFTSGRVGKTSVLMNTLGSCIDQDPCPILGIQPTDQDAREWSKDQISGTIRDTPVLRDKVVDSGSRRSDNTITHKVFPGGYLKVAGANSPRGFRRITIRVILADEVDGYPPSAGREGDPLELAKNRTMTVWNKKIIITSTPTVTGVSRIEEEWELSDKRHCYVPCPRCGHYQVLIFWGRSKFTSLGNGKGFLKFDNENGHAKNVRYICENCEAELTEADKIRMIRRCQWRALEPDRKGVAGFHINTLYSTFVTWADVAQNFVSAQGSQEKLRAFVNIWLGETWDDSESYSVSVESLLNRRETYTKVPNKVLVLTQTVDVQHNRFEMVVKGWGLNDESWLIDYDFIYGQPEVKSTWALLDEYLQREWEREDGTRMRVLTTFVDSGYLAPVVYEFCQARRHRRIFAIHGRSPWSSLFTKPARRSKSSERVITVGVDHAKEIIYPRLRVLDDKHEGFMHYNQKATPEYFDGLTSEKPVIIMSKTGIRRRIWRKLKNRVNEPWDLEVYNYAAYKFSRVNLELRRRELEKMAGKTGDPSSSDASNRATLNDAQKRPTFFRPRKNWIKDW
jgi:phage terminase large subunit GpA-like protein